MKQASKIAVTTLHHDREPSSAQHLRQIIGRRVLTRPTPPVRIGAAASRFVISAALRTSTPAQALATMPADDLKAELRTARRDLDFVRGALSAARFLLEETTTTPVLEELIAQAAVNCRRVRLLRRALRAALMVQQCLQPAAPQQGDTP